MEYVEMNMSRAKDQLQSEVAHLYIQLQKANQFNEELKAQCNNLTVRIREQEVIIAGLRSFAETDKYELEHCN